MVRLDIENKMISLSYETKIKFNLEMHGVQKDAEVQYGKAKPELQMLIRRRIADNDGSVEIIQPGVKETESTIETGRAVSTKKPKGVK